jgi:hypothetical protein
MMSQSLMHPASYIGGMGLQPSHSHPFGVPQASLMGMTPNPGLPTYSHQGMQSQMGATFSDLTSNFGGNPMHT